MARGGYRHHLCWQKNKWRDESLNRFRNCPYCVIRLYDQGLHDYIHQHMRGIRPPRPINADRALEQIVMLYGAGAISDDDPIERRLALLIGLFDCIAPETTEDFKKQLELVREYRNLPSTE